jgi:hypothetical protein
MISTLLPYAKQEHLTNPTLDLEALIHILISCDNDQLPIQSPKRLCAYRLAVGAHTLETDEIYGVSIDGFVLNISIGLQVRFQNVFRELFNEQNEKKKIEYFNKIVNKDEHS